MFKRILALTLTALLLVSAMIIPASAGSMTASHLYVGEKNKSNDNIISMFNKDGVVLVHSVNDDKAYYTLTRDPITHVYILSFYNDYKYSEPVEYGSSKYGIYCDGDLEIRVYGSAEFNLNKHPETGAPVTNAYGVYVKGTLTITDGVNTIPTVNYSKFTANGDLRKSTEYTDSIGIYADTLLINEVSVNANGGYAGVVAKNTIAVVDAELHANRAPELFSSEINPNTGKPVALFAYGISTDLFVQASVRRSAPYCKVSVGGDIYVKSYIMKKNHLSSETDRLGTNFDTDVVVYLKDFLLEEIDGKTYHRGDSFKVINKNLPSCIYLATGTIYDANGYDKWPTPRLSIDGQYAKVVDGDGIAGIGIFLDCGDAAVLFDYAEVNCERTVLQKIWDFIAYYILFGWVIGKV